MGLNLYYDSNVLKSAFVDRCMKYCLSTVDKVEFKNINVLCMHACAIFCRQDEHTTLNPCTCDVPIPMWCLGLTMVVHEFSLN